MIISTGAAEQKSAQVPLRVTGARSSYGLDADVSLPYHTNLMSTNRFPVELEGWSIVLRGNFNPAIFQPMWLVKHGLVFEEEAAAAKITVITPELAIFSVGLMTLLITLDKFQVAVTSAEASEAIRDLVVGTFHILNETPLTQLGINRDLHFKIPSIEQWYTVGHRLAPKEIWSGLLDDLGTRSVVMQGKRRDASSEYVRVRVEPSARVRPGVYVGNNEHFVKAPNEASEHLLDVLRAEWASAQASAKRVAEELIARCLQ